MPSRPCPKGASCDSPGQRLGKDPGNTSSPERAKPASTAQLVSAPHGSAPSGRQDGSQGLPWAITCRPVGTMTMRPVTAMIVRPVAAMIMRPVTAMTMRPVTAIIMRPVAAMIMRSVAAMIMRPVAAMIMRPVAAMIMRPVAAMIMRPVAAMIMRPVAAITPCFVTVTNHQLQAPKGRHEIAQGNALGKTPAIHRALKGRNLRAPVRRLMASGG